MKKLVAFVFMLIVIAAAGIGVSAAADFSVETTSFPQGKAYEDYGAKNVQIRMTNGNQEDYTFTSVAKFKPNGINVESDGRITGIPTSFGSYGAFNVLISHIDGTSQIVPFSIVILPRQIEVVVDAQDDNAVYDKTKEYRAKVEYRENGQIISETDIPLLAPTYGTDQLDFVVNAGSYYINVPTPPGCTIVSRTGDTHLTVKRAPGPSLRVWDARLPYTGQPQEFPADKIEINPAIDYIVEYAKSGTSTYTQDPPSAAGSYTVRVSTADSNYMTISATASLVIEGTAINFTVEGTPVGYTGQAPTVTFTPIPSVEGIGFRVSYRASDGTLFESTPADAGTYKILITLTGEGAEAYSVGTLSSEILEITPVPIKFSLDSTSVPFNNGQAYTPNVTTDPSFDSNKYSVSYIASDGSEYTSPANADTYEVKITMKDSNYAASEDSVKTFTITPIPVSFTVTNNVVDYDGKEHGADVSAVGVTLPNGAYEVSYTKQGTSETVSKVKDAGVYDINISFKTNNYVLAEGFSATMTVNTAIMLNPGNSPAAMIYKDETHKNDAQWQTDALNELKNNGQFSSTHTPAGCSASVKYGLINSLDLDTDVNTLIVTDITNFTDPGMDVGGTTVTTDILLPVSGVSGLYELVYNYESTEKGRRYVLEVPGKIGDINGDGSVNAVDANYLNKHLSQYEELPAEPTSIVEWRMWDVNMDGDLSKDDARAIQNRFANPLNPYYYPWVVE